MGEQLKEIVPAAQFIESSKTGREVVRMALSKALDCCGPFEFIHTRKRVLHLRELCVDVLLRRLAAQVWILVCFSNHDSTAIVWRNSDHATSSAHLRTE